MVECLTCLHLKVEWKLFALDFEDERALEEVVAVVLAIRFLLLYDGNYVDDDAENTDSRVYDRLCDEDLACSGLL